MSDNYPAGCKTTDIPGWGPDDAEFERWCLANEEGMKLQFYDEFKEEVKQFVIARLEFDGDNALDMLYTDWLRETWKAEDEE